MKLTDFSQQEPATPEGAFQKAAAQVEAGEDPLSVSDFLNSFNKAFKRFPFTILGEVSEVNAKPGYRAVYFTLKDASASLSCLMWNERYQRIGIPLAVGMLVEVKGRVSVYASKGRMNFDVESYSLAGEGNLRLQVDQLARKLQAEGLMAPEKKRPLPTYPSTIGVVTSPRGAAVHDVLRTLRRRFPLAKVLVAGVPVEGPQAPEWLVYGLQMAAYNSAEVIIFGRGGGSFEDLMPFNDERVARAVATCPVPVVTGIGHEPDTTISDMVADLRASTPTAAAEAVAPSKEALGLNLSALGNRMTAAMERSLALHRTKLQRFALMPLFQEPGRLFDNEALTLDNLSDRLARALPAALGRDRQATEALQDRLVRCAALFSAPQKATLERTRVQLAALGTNLTRRFKAEAALNAARLEDLSPLSVLARGFSVARTQEGAVVSSVTQVSSDQALSILVTDGTIESTVAAIRPKTSAQEGAVK